MTDTPFSRFQALLSEIFQFDTGDLDFGIYRILNAKRQQVEAFINTDLQAVVDRAFTDYAATKSEVAAGGLDAARAKVVATLGAEAFDAEGQLSLTYQNTPVGKEFVREAAAAAQSTATDSLKEKVYNDLLTFFSRYYEDGDFLPLRRAGREMTYAVPYSGEEVVLHWANRGQYYVKTDDRLTAYRFRVAGDFHVSLEVRSARTEQNNNKGAKRFYSLADGDADGYAVDYEPDTKTLHIYFAHRPLTSEEEGQYPAKKKQEPINQATFDAVLARVQEMGLRAALAAPYTPKEGEPAPATAAPTLLRHLAQFTKKNTADFFVHKNLSGFLTGEIEHFIKTECLRLDDLLEASGGDFELMTARARATKAVGAKVIALLASVEDFQRRLFEKRKFVLRTDYVFTLDRVPASLHASILANAVQVQEWRDLYDVDGLLATDGVLGQGGLTLDAMTNEPYNRLPVDTRHFDAAFKAELLASLDDLDDLTDGVLFESENLQALNLLTETYRERVKCVYIDPPYNTSASEILYKNDYKHSSWLSLIDNRIKVSTTFLKPDGIMCVTIDDAELHGLWYVMTSYFPAELHLGTVPIRNNPQGRATLNGFRIKHEYALFFAKEPGTKVGRLERTESQNARYGEVDDEGLAYTWENFRKTGTDSHRADRQRQYYPIYTDGNAIRVPKMTWNEERREYEINEQPKDGENVLWPIDESGNERVWRWGYETIGEKPTHIKIEVSESSDIQVYNRIYVNPEGGLPGTWWEKPQYAAGSHGTNLLTDLFGGGRAFLFPKSVYAVEDCLRVGGASESGAVCLDFFAGSGTTGHAIINLERGAPEGTKRRKFVLAEMGTYFDTVLLPRIKKVIFASLWSGGKPASRDPLSYTIKYHALEQYEDTLNNLRLRPTEESQMAMDVYGEDYLLRYLLDFDTVGSPSLLNVADLADPFHYAVRVRAGDDFAHQSVDLPETFSYLLGLQVRKVRAFTDADRDYRAVLGTDRNGKTVAHLWRRSSDLAGNADALKQDAAFITGTVLPSLTDTRPDRLFINGAFAGIDGAENCEPDFLRLMFAPVGTV